MSQRFFRDPGIFSQRIERAEFIDLSEKTKKAKVVREGFEVPTVAIEQKQAEFTINNLVTVQPKAMPRVVSQSIAAGTRVTPGTVIDFVVVPKSDIPFNIFTAVHESLTPKTLDFVDDLVENTTIREVLLKRESAAAVTPDEKKTLVTALQAKGIVVDDNQPGKTFEKAFNSVRSAAAFR